MAAKVKSERKPDPMVDHLAIPQGINKRVDLPPEAYFMPGSTHTPFAVRPGYNQSAQDIRVAVNQFRITTISSPDVHQYDVSVKREGVEVDRPAIYKKVWQCKAVQEKLKSTPKPWIYDGRKLAWSTNHLKSFKLEVDLGEDDGHAGRKNNQFVFELTYTNKVRMEALRSYLERRTSWDTTVLECLSFLDHVLRQGPSENFLLIKRVLFNNVSETQRLNNYTEAIKGIYSAIRLNQPSPGGSVGLGVNVDVSNQTFWVGQKFEQLARNYISGADKKFANMTYDTMKTALQPTSTTKSDGSKTWVMSEAFKYLRRLQNVQFKVVHRGGETGDTVYKVKGFTFSQQYGQQGGHAKAITFDRKMEDGTIKKYSIFQYYLEKYKLRLQHWYFPLIETTRGGYFPMEVCEVTRFNRFPFKLDPQQTSDMIKFAVQRPPQRKAEIMKMVENLEWDKDRYLAHFGIKISPAMPMFQAKLIKNPVVQFGNTTKDPSTSGRWDLRNVRFAAANPRPLVSWAFVIVDGCVDRPTLDNFVRLFQTTYRGHGGVITNAPEIIDPPRGQSHESLVHNSFLQCGNKFRATPQIIFFILKDKNAMVYDRLKRSADIGDAVLTQMLQAQHVRRAQAQYCSNVCMKANAKLGGQTSRIQHPPKGSFFKVPTMMIGVDLSHGHGGGGGVRPLSMAAMCVSMDREAAIYNAAVQTNGYGVEILQPGNMHSMLGPLVVKWKTKFNVAPQHVFYVRDGVSEGQFAHVMEWEFEEMKKVFKETVGVVPKITVIIATKRHHIRFFPERGDKNGNCLPGTLVEREVTHPYHYDFYLCSHSAIQGTARPVHYNVLHDECRLPPDDLQRILYHQCYQYCRSTTPVSLHPAVYYAHLASARARHHEDLTATANGQERRELNHVVLLRQRGSMAKHDGKTSTSVDESSWPPLVEVGAHGGRPDAKQTFTNTMWWV